jgi:hypothetical protein
VPADQRLNVYAASRNTVPPKSLGSRYDATGRFLPEPGNTIVCHLVDGSASAHAVLGFRNRAAAQPFARHLAFTAPTSLHMTLFQGIIETRRAEGYWLPGVPLDTPIEAMTAMMLERLGDQPPLPPFRIKATDAVPTGLTVAGVGPEDVAALAAGRDRLADVFGYRHPDHDTYEFHITFAYLIRWLPDEELAGITAFFDEGLAELQAAAPEIALRPPAFCRFEDMHRFEELRVLG